MKEIIIYCNKILSYRIVPYTILTMLSFLFVFLNFGSISPLFASQGLDSSVYELMGLAILRGKIPYQDLFDHKGPMMYFIQAFGQFIIPGRNGIFLLEVMSLSICTILWYKICRIFISSIRSLLVVCLTLFTYYSITLTGESGNMTEEWSMLFITISAYLILKQFLLQWNINVTSLIVGICLACGFFIRPNDAVAFIGGPLLGLTWIYLRNTEYRKILDLFLFVSIGIFIVSVPIIVYFGINDALSDLWYGLIGYNRIYSGGLSVLLASCLGNQKYVFFPILVTICLLTFQQYKRLFPLLLPTCIFCYILLGSKCYMHYFIAWIPIIFFSFWLLLLDNQINKTILILSLFVYLSLPFYNKRNILKLPYRTYREIKLALKNVPKEEAYYQRSSMLFESVSVTDRDSIWSYNLGWNDTTSTFGVLWRNNIVPCNRLALTFLANKDENLQKDMDITRFSPKYILISQQDEYLSTYSARDSSYISQEYSILSQCNKPDLVLYKRHN